MKQDFLPRLSSKPLDHTITCKDHSCEGCQLVDICNQQRCDENFFVQHECNRDCNDCGGGADSRYQGKMLPAVCCKSPLKDIYLNAVKRDKYVFKKRPHLQFKGKHVAMLSGVLSGKYDQACPDGTEVVGANMRYIFTPRGWPSTDMKDFLKIPNGTKLILFSCMYDLYLERAWSAGFHYTDPGDVGFDYWEVYELSMFDDYSNFYNLWEGYRMLYAAQESGSWFMQRPPHCLSSRKKKKSHRHWIEWSKKVPQMTVIWQFVSLRDKARWRAAVASLRVSLQVLPNVKALWFQGVSTPSQVFNLTLAFPEYDLYFISSNPVTLAAHRKRMDLQGGKHDSQMERYDLLLHNQKNYATLVRSSIQMAREKLR